MIKILSTILVNDIDGGEQTRCSAIVITGIGAYYSLNVGGLPLEGDLQPVLDARQNELLEVAILKGNIRTAQEVRYLLYAEAWSNEAFQAAIIENMAENVGGGMPRFTNILELFDQINDDWPIQGEED